MTATKVFTKIADDNRMDIASIALQGVQQSESLLQTATAGLVNAGTTAGPNLDVANIASRIVAVNSAQTSFELSIDALKTADQIQNTINELA